MEMHNWIFEKLQKKTFLIGAFCASCDANLVEILGLNGIDFVVLDMEHSPLDLENMVHMIRAAEMYQVVPIVRVYTPEGKLIRRILDIGAHGIMVPLVDSREETMEILDAVKYPPLGKRGMNYGRGPRWGEYENYVQQANEALSTFVQCETAEGVRSIKEITAVPGLTGVFIGSADLSMSLGHPQDLHHPEVDGAFHRVLTACKKQGILAGIATSSMQEAVLRISGGLSDRHRHERPCFFQTAEQALFQRDRSRVCRYVTGPFQTRKSSETRRKYLCWNLAFCRGAAISICMLRRR